METLFFSAEPTFAELWDACVYRCLYDIEAYRTDIRAILEQKGIGKNSHIIDVAAGGGFPALELIEDGYMVDCADGSEDQVSLFHTKAQKKGLSATCRNILWKNLPGTYSPSAYDFLFCRGNSFIYADGGWNSTKCIDQQRSLEAYENTLRIFYSLLKEGGHMYIDKFKDSEVSQREEVADIRVDNEPMKLIFSVRSFTGKKLREASLLLRDAAGNESGLPNLTYRLSESELLGMMDDVGFKNIAPLRLESESHFDVWIAQK